MKNMTQFGIIQHIFSTENLKFESPFDELFTLVTATTNKLQMCFPVGYIHLNTKIKKGHTQVKNSSTQFHNIQPQTTCCVPKDMTEHVFSTKLGHIFFVLFCL